MLLLFLPVSLGLLAIEPFVARSLDTRIITGISAVLLGIISALQIKRDRQDAAGV